ncbi:MAG: glycosyltransferase family 87 protein [Bacteroidota bacterium]
MAFLCLNIITTCVAASMGFGYPYDTFLFIPEDRFADFFKVMDALNVTETWPGYNPYDITLDLYALPFGTVYYFGFAKLIAFVGNKYVVYTGLILLLLVLLTLIIRKKGSSNSVVLLIFLSYPIIYAIDRGNIAFVVFILVLFALTTDNILLASIAIAFAVSIKVIPAIFILPVILTRPFSVKRTLMAIGILIVGVVVINFLSVKIINSQLTNEPFTFAEFSRMIGFFYKDDLLNFRGLAFGSSLYLPLLYSAETLNVSYQFLNTIRPATVPLIIFSIIGIFLIAKYSFSSLVEKYLTYEKTIFVLCICFILFPPVSADYYLIMMFIPLIIFPKTQYSLGYFLCYGILLGAKNFIHIGDTDVSWQSFINPFLLLILLISEFDLIPFIKRSTETVAISESSFFKGISKTLKPFRTAFLVFVAVSVVLFSILIYYQRAAKIAKAKEYASAFPKKEWYYSVDGGKTWVERAEGGLKNFDSHGDPIHVLTAWKTGRWVDANTILWVSVVGNEAVWKAIYEPPILSPPEIQKQNEYKSKFHEKIWFYSTDDGVQWIGNAEDGLNGFDFQGNAVHKDPVWNKGEWIDENTISWHARNGSKAIWKGYEKMDPAQLSEEEISRNRSFANLFNTKKWYYSTDGGKNFNNRAESDLNRFDENGNPIHKSAVWGMGKWKDENTIYWRASNNSESIWKALDHEP